MLIIGYDKHTALKPYATKAWPYYRKMQGFMPGTQPRGVHSFDPAAVPSATLELNSVNAEDDGDEDQAGPPFDTSMTDMPAAFDSVLSHIFPPAADTVSLAGTSQSNAMPPPFSSSISPTHPKDGSSSHSHINHFSVNSSISHTTSSENQTTSSMRKRKRNATADMPPPSSKRGSKNRTDTLNPVIISSQLNSTLIHIADVMEKSLNVTATSIEPTTATHPPPLPTSQTSSVPSQLPGPSSASPSDSEILDKAIGILMADKDFLSEDDLLAASLFFSNTSNEVIRVARNFIALSNKPGVQHRFLLHQLEEAGLRTTGKGKGKAVANDNDFQMTD